MVTDAASWARYQTKIRNVIEYIHTNVSGDLSNDALADVAHLSVYHWHRIYRAVTGESAASTVKRCRMQKAAATLLRTDDPIAAVGNSVGIADVHSFTRTFKAYYGIAPGQFRKTNPPFANDGKAANASDANTESTSNTVIIKDLPETQLMGIWHHGDYMEIGQSFEKVMAVCSMHQLLPDAPQSIGVYYGDPEIVALDQQRSFAGIVVNANVQAPPDLERYLQPSGRFAVLTHRGPYARLGQSYGWLYSCWLPASGETLRDSPCCEVYLNSPIGISPDELLTEICLPLE